MTTQKQKRPEEFDNMRKAPAREQNRHTPAGPHDREAREAADGNRFDKERQDRDRGTFESQNQGHGPHNVGDQSRTR
jgi:hypothetical protein